MNRTMAVRVRVEPEEELTPRERKEVVADVNLFIALRSRLAHSDLRALRTELAQVVVADEAHGSQSREIHPATGEPVPSESEQALLGFRSLLRFFEARRELLDDTLTAPQAAELLGVSRQTPLNRVKDNTLLAVLDRGAYRFPIWQFDPRGEDGVLPGLPDVLDALEPQQPFAKLIWLRRSNPTLAGREPVELLRDREIEPVVGAAHAAAELP
jgi:excisionase family DNA binding protein